MGQNWVPEEHGTHRGGLQRQVARGLTWTVTQSTGEQLITLGVFLILARLLTPEDFGLVALAMVFVSFAQLVVDQGLGDALIQRKALARSHIDTAFWVAVATGALLTIVGIGLAYPIASLLDEPRMAPMLQVLSFTFALSAMSSIQIALLRRELAFRGLALRALASALGGGVVGIAMAWLGFGAWSLVGQQIGYAVLSVVTLWAVSPWRPSFEIARHEFRQLFSFGINVVGSDVLNFVSRNSDNLLIGVFLGTTPLGLYAVGYRILSASQSILVNVARRITFPAFSRLQHDAGRIRRAYFRVTRAGSVLILPGYIGLSIVATELTVVLAGQRWAESGPVAAILLLIGPVLTVQAFSGSLLNAVGHPEIVFRLRLISTAANVVGFAIAVSFGILAVAAAFVIRGYALLPLTLYWMRKYADMPIREYLGQLRGIAAATAFMAAAMLIVKVLLAGHIGPGLLLLAEVAVGAPALIVALAVIERSLAREVLTVFVQATPGAERLARRGRLPDQDEENLNAL